MTTSLILAIPVVVLALCRVCYCLGFIAAQKQVDQIRVQSIRKIHLAWRDGMLAERMRQFSPKDVSKN